MKYKSEAYSKYSYRQNKIETSLICKNKISRKIDALTEYFKNQEEERNNFQLTNLG